MGWDFTSGSALSQRNIKTESDLRQYKQQDNAPTRQSQAQNRAGSRADIQQKINEYRAAISGSLKKHADNVNVVSRDEIVRPENAQDLMNVEGFYNPKDGKITLIAESLRDSNHARFVAWHELAHRKIDVSGAADWHKEIKRAGNHSTVKQLADKIQAQRKDTDDTAATNRAIANEEAIAELYAAHETGDYAALERKYEMKIPRVLKRNLGGFLSRLGEKLASVWRKISGSQAVSGADVYGLLQTLSRANDGTRATNSGSTKRSSNADCTAYDQAKADGRTELTFAQWQQVRTPEFKAWFGDWENDPENASKVINPKTGEPLVLYHGSPTAGFSEFHGGDNETIHLSNDKNMAAQYSGTLEKAVINDNGDEAAGIYHVFANMKKPLIIEWEYREWNDAPPLYYVNKNGETTIQRIDNESEFLEQNGEVEIIDMQVGSIDELARTAQDENYDGVIAKNLVSMGRYVDDFFPDFDTNEYIVYSSNQLKSATDNIGTFDPNNDDIRYSQESTNAFTRPKSESLAKLKDMESIYISGKEIKPSNDLRQYKKNAIEYGKQLRGEYTNKDTGRRILLGRKSVLEVLNHDYKNPEHLQSIAAIPQIIENSVFIAKLPSEDVAKNPDIQAYEYYLAGLNIGGVDYTVRAAIGVSSTGDKYYDHKLTQIEKGNLSEIAYRTTAEISDKLPNSGIDDKRLLQLLQDENSGSLKNDNGIRYSRGTTPAQVAQFTQTAQISNDPTLLQALRGDRTADYLAGKKTTLGKVQDWLIEGFADHLHPVSKWIDSLPVAEQTRELFKQSMYRAGGMRDYQNEIITQQFIEPMTAELRRIAKANKLGFVETKRLIGYWGSANYAPIANARLLQRDKDALDQARANGEPQAKIDQLQKAYDDRQAAAVYFVGGFGVFDLSVI